MALLLPHLPPLHRHRLRKLPPRQPPPSLRRRSLHPLLPPLLHRPQHLRKLPPHQRPPSLRRRLPPLHLLLRQPRLQ